MRTGTSPLVAFVLGACVASAIWWSQWSSQLDSAREEAASEGREETAKFAPSEWLRNKETCETESIPCSSMGRAWVSGLYWPPGTTLKTCAQR